MISSHCSSLANSEYFNRFIIATILLAGVVVGAQTYPNFAQENAHILSFLDRAILIIFILEASIKILAEGKNPFNYFKNPWNVFDSKVLTILSNFRPTFQTAIYTSNLEIPSRLN